MSRIQAGNAVCHPAIPFQYLPNYLEGPTLTTRTRVGNINGENESFGYSFEQEGEIGDERTYRGGNHPPYCTCVGCTNRRLTGSSKNRKAAKFSQNREVMEYSFEQERDKRRKNTQRDKRRKNTQREISDERTRRDGNHPPYCLCVGCTNRRLTGSSENRESAKSSKNRKVMQYSFEQEREISDERTYRDGNHPPYCMCVECTNRKAAESSQDRKVAESSQDRKAAESSQDRKAAESSKDRKAAKSSKDRKAAKSSKSRKAAKSSKKQERKMSDERTYRGGNHPPYCTCVECTNRKAAESSKRGLSKLVSKIGRMLRVR